MTEIRSWNKISKKHQIKLCKIKLLPVSRRSGKRKWIITISSVDDYSYKIVDSIINCFFDNNAKLYYASGLPDNIDEIYEDIKQFNPYYNAGDSKKFYIRRYPQICADLSDEKILSYNYQVHKKSI